MYYLFFVFSSDITSGSLATFIPAICARPEIIKNLIRTNPEQVRKLARQFGFGDLPENLTPESLDLTPICGKPGQKVKAGLFGLPDLFAGNFKSTKIVVLLEM